MIFENIEVRNDQRSFDGLQQDRLGLYVYTLIDPRDGKIFYIGQGANNRIFDHLNDAEAKLTTDTSASSKEIRILEIWKSCEDVRWQIVAHKLEQDSANAVEAATIDIMSISQNGPCLNDIRGPGSSMLSEGEVTTLGAAAMNPHDPVSRVFLFPVHNALSDSRENVYQATRASWNVSGYDRDRKGYAVGIKDGISVGCFKIDGWEKHKDKYAFIGQHDDSLLNFDWKPVIRQTLGYWQRGNYLIVEFDGRGKFRFLRGSLNKGWITI